jgi:hypothetical protein
MQPSFRPLSLPCLIWRAQGIVEANSIAYPLNQGCGTGFEYTSTVKAWIYDKAGGRSKPVIIHLACTT